MLLFNLELFSLKMLVDLLPPSSVIGQHLHLPLRLFISTCSFFFRYRSYCDMCSLVQISLTFNQLCPAGVFLIVRRPSKLLNHGISCSSLPSEINVFRFCIWPMTFYRIVGVKAVSLLMNSGRCYLQLSRVSIVPGMKMERKQLPDW